MYKLFNCLNDVEEKDKIIDKCQTNLQVV